MLLSLFFRKKKKNSDSNFCRFFLYFSTSTFSTTNYQIQRGGQFQSIVSCLCCSCCCCSVAKSIGQISRRRLLLHSRNEFRQNILHSFAGCCCCCRHQATPEYSTLKESKGKNVCTHSTHFYYLGESAPFFSFCSKSHRL